MWLELVDNILHHKKFSSVVSGCMLRSSSVRAGFGQMCYGRVLLIEKYVGSSPEVDVQLLRYVFMWCS